MKDFTSKGISLENMVGETPGKEKGMNRKNITQNEPDRRADGRSEMGVTDVRFGPSLQGSQDTA